jgi:hypothetical protein
MSYEVTLTTALASLPVTGIIIGPQTGTDPKITWYTIQGVSVGVVWSVVPTQTQSNQASSILTVLDPRPKVSRSLFAIYNDLVALTVAQKTNVWTDLTSGSPQKITMTGNDTVFLLWRIASNASLPAATITDMKLTAATYYVRDNPRYLVQPSFDSSINVAGDQLA